MNNPVLRVLRLPAALCLLGCSSAAGQGILTNGWTYSGLISAAVRSNTWTFAATSGESIVVAMGATNGNLYPYLHLYAPGGALQASAVGPTATEISVQATNSGTFSIVAANDDAAANGGTGTYRLTLAATAGSIVVSPGDHGGPMTNGYTFQGNLEAGQLNVWSFTASVGENIVAGIGSTDSRNSLYPYLRLYGPNGALLSANWGPNAIEVSAQATNAGTFTVVAANDDSAVNGGNGSYDLTLADTAGPIVVAPGSQGGSLTNGYTYTGTLMPGQLSVWSFNANSGDSLVGAMGAMSGNLYPYLRLYGPNGALLSANWGPNAIEVTSRATNSGTFILVAANDDSAVNGGSGAFQVTLGSSAGSIVVSPGDQGGPMLDGYTYQGNLAAGQLSVWSFTASVGENIVAGIGSTDSRNSLYPYLRLYGPNGALLSASWGPNAAEVSAQATNAGTFTLVAANDDSAVNGGNGPYGLTLADTAGPIVVAPGSQGGSMTNGYTYPGTLMPGQLSVWSFSANSGDNLVAGLGALTDNLYPYLRLYGPNGALLAAGYGPNGAEAAARATNSGIFTLVVANDDSAIDGGEGAFELTMGSTANSLAIAPGDLGGLMNGGDNYAGELDPGEIVVWKFTACAGDLVAMSMQPTSRGDSLYPYLRLYGPNGALVASAYGPSSIGINTQTTNNGTFTVMAANDESAVNGGYGTFQLTVNGLSDGFRECDPVISGATATLTGIGGPPGTNFVLYTTVDLSTSLASWTPIWTNQFDAFGVFSHTNAYLGEPQRYFRVRYP